VKKMVSVILLSAVVLVSSLAYAVDMSPLVTIRDKFLQEGKEIKPLLTESKDVILLSSMWDSCVMAVSQLNAYFYMVGIYNTVDETMRSYDAVNYLVKWLTEIRATNSVNVKSLDNISIKLDEKSKFHVDKLRGYFEDLNKQIDVELGNLSVLMASLKAPSPAKPQAKE